MAGEKVIKLTNENFEETALEKGVALVDFWAPWCGPCRMVGPIVEELAHDYDGKAAVCKVNVDENEELSAKYKVMSIPTLIVFKDGVQVEKAIGVQNKEELEELLDKHI